MKNKTQNTSKNDVDKHAEIKARLLSLAEDLCVAYWNGKATKPIFENMLATSHALPVAKFSNFFKTMLSYKRFDWDTTAFFLSFDLDMENAADHIATLCRLYSMYRSIDATRPVKTVRAAIVRCSAQFVIYCSQMKEAA